MIARRLREQDSVYILGASCFGAILPGADATTAERFSASVSEGLADAAGAGNRFSFKIDIVNYPNQALSVTELEEAVLTLMPATNSMHGMAAIS